MSVSHRRVVRADVDADKYAHAAYTSTHATTHTSTQASPNALTTLSRPTLTFYLIHANITLYAFFYWFNQPVLPYLSKELGGDPLTFGYFQSFTSFTMLIGTMVMGRLIDRRGVKIILLISHLAGSVSYLLLFLADSIPLLFLSQIPTIAMSAMHASQVYIILLTSPDTRAKSLGRLSLSYGVGMLLGPIIGGTLSKYIGYSNISCISCVGSLLVTLTLAVYLPFIDPAALKSKKEEEREREVDGNKHERTDASAPAESTSGSMSAGLSAIRTFVHLLSLSNIRTAILVKLLVTLSLSTYRSSLSQIVQYQYGMSAQSNGYILSFAASLAVVANTFAIGYLTGKYSEYVILRGGLIAILISLLLSTLTLMLPAHAALGLLQVYDLPVEFWLLMLYIVPMTVGGAVCQTLLTSTLSHLSSMHHAGSVLALDMGTGTLARVIAPTLGGVLMLYHAISVGVVSSTITALALLFTLTLGGHTWQTKQVHATHVQMSKPAPVVS